MPHVPRRLPSAAGVYQRVRERVLGPGGRSPRQSLDVIRRLSCDDVCRFATAHQLGLQETMTRLVSSDVSLARFGDGEFGSMVQRGYDLYLQRSSDELTTELREVWT